MTPENNRLKMDIIKKKIIISMCAIILLALTIFGITYAYFTSKVVGNKNDISVEVSAARLELVYDGEDSYIEVEGLMPGTTIESKIFSVTNNGTRTIENYEVILENLVNELDNYEDLTFTLECESNLGNDCKNISDIFPKYNKAIAINTIEPNEKHSYRLTLTYNETNTNQSIDMNKEISARVNIRHDVSNNKTLKIHGNSNQDGTPSVNNPIEIKSLGNLIEDENDLNYGKYQIPISIKGKNLFDKSKSSNEGIKNETEKKYWASKVISEVEFDNMIKEPGTYTLSYDIEFIDVPENFGELESGYGGGMYGLSILENVDGTKYNHLLSAYQNYKKEGTKEHIVRNFTISQEQIDANYTFYAYSNAYYADSSKNIGKLASSSVKITNIQIEKGSTETEYEPYQGKEYNIYLDEPLRKIGNYSDYIDIVNKTVVRRIKHLNLSATQGWGYRSDSSQYVFAYEISDALQEGETVLVSSNRYKGVKRNAMYSKGIVGISSGGAIRISASLMDGIIPEMTALAFTKFLKTNPTYAEYVMNKESEPIHIDIPSISIKNNYNVNVCSNNGICASNIEVEYDE